MGNAYFRGVNLLLNEQSDKAIDAFVDVVRIEPEPANCTSPWARCSAAVARPTVPSACTRTLVDRPDLDDRTRATPSMSWASTS